MAFVFKIDKNRFFSENVSKWFFSFVYKFLFVL